VTIKHIGANDLGLTVEWRFGFVGPGSTIEAVRDTVFVDVGNRLEKGIYDEHGGVLSPGGSSHLILQHPSFAYEHLLAPWLDRKARGDQIAGATVTFTIATHFNPDFDAILSAYLVKVLIETGGFPAHAEALAQYGKCVDLGRYTVDLEQLETAVQPVHMGILALQKCRKGSQAVMEAGLTLLGEAVQDMVVARQNAGAPPLRSLTDFFVGEPGISTWRTRAAWADCVGLLDADLAKYKVDREHAEMVSVSIPARHSAAYVDVPFFILRQASQSALNKYWVRADKCCGFVCPYTPNASRANVFDRVIISLDPTWRCEATGLAPSLEGLGYQLERAEHGIRCQDKKTDARIGPPRYDDGSCTNGDPWYDGRGHEYTIVDTPRDGTHLTLNQIVDVLRSPFLEPKCVEVRLFCIEDLADDEVHGYTWVVPEIHEELYEGLRPYVSDCMVSQDTTTDAALFDGAIDLELKSFVFKSPDGFGGAFKVTWFGLARGTPLVDLVTWYEKKVKRTAPRIRSGRQGTDPRWTH
jgi:hypothetical protein